MILTANVLIMLHGRTLLSYFSETCTHGVVCPHRCELVCVCFYHLSCNYKLATIPLSRNVTFTHKWILTTQVYFNHIPTTHESILITRESIPTICKSILTTRDSILTMRPLTSPWRAAMTCFQVQALQFSVLSMFHSFIHQRVHLIKGKDHTSHHTCF